MANTCPVCSGKMGLLNREKSADGLICSGCSNFCYSKLGIRAAKVPTDALAAYWSELERRRKDFKETDSLFDSGSLFVSIDRSNRLFCFGHRGGDKGPRMIYSFGEVTGYESDADDVMVTKSVGGVGRAVVGAAIAGPVGAIVGASTAKTETRKGKLNETVTIHLTLPIGAQTIASTVYPAGMTDLLKECVNGQKEPEAAQASASSAADELLKYKQLLDLGAITEDEYNAKKAQLLDL